MIAFRLRSYLCVALLLGGSSVAQRHREPLTQPEIDQIRDASWEPRQRLTLYVQFARTRLVKMEQMRSDPKTTKRARQTHDLLDDFQLLYDELNDNIDTYVDRKDDIRKPLKLIIDADTEFEAKLRALKDAADIPAEESHQYEFVLTNVLEAVDASAEDHRKLLADQEDAAKHKKLNSNSSAKNGGKPE
jgi:Arc/MetJ-type ribon-helix-helix transcriptional regulator